MTQSVQGLPCPRLTVVVPCHNEEQVLSETTVRLVTMLDTLTQRALIVEPSIFLVDDGSSDGTWRVIERLAVEHPTIHGLKLSRNFGQQSALLAGLLTAPGDALISIDADLQDDVAAIEEMVRAYSGGAEVVYGIRRSRKTDSFFKRTTAEGYYRLLQSMGVELIFNHADFRLLSRRVVEELRSCKESNLLLRGLIPQLGFPSSLVYYDRQARCAGDSQYSDLEDGFSGCERHYILYRNTTEDHHVAGHARLSFQLWPRRMGIDRQAAPLSRGPRLGLHRDSALHAGGNTTAVSGRHRAISRENILRGQGKASLHRRKESLGL